MHEDIARIKGMVKDLLAQVQKPGFDTIVCVPATLKWLRDKFPEVPAYRADDTSGISVLEAPDNEGAFVLASELVRRGRRVKILLEEAP